MIRGSGFKRIVSLVVVVCFVTTNAIAMPLESLSPVMPGAELRSSFQLPEKLGSLMETSAGKSGKTLVYIQDAHDSLEAQENIAGMVRYLVKEYGIKTVYEEGYEGPVPTDKIFGAIDDPALKEKLSYYLMDKLRVGGAEYAHINRSAEPSSRETANGERLTDRSAFPVPRSPQSDFQLVGADSIALHLENIRAYEQAAKNRGEVTRDIWLIRKELQKLIDKNFPKEMKEWLKLKERYQQGQMPLVEYLQRTWKTRGTGNVERETKALDVPRSSFPEISKLLSGDEKKIQQIDLMALLKEIEQLEGEIVESGLSSERDRKTYGYYQSVLLLEKMNAIELSHEEFTELKGSLEGLKTEDVARFLAQETGRSIVMFRSWEGLITDATRFYELAMKRDLSIGKIFDGFLQDPEAKAAALVFGGFHKEAIKKILKEKGIGYVILSPAIGAPSKRHQDYYRMLMSGGKHDFEKDWAVGHGTRDTKSGEAGVAHGPESVARESTCPQRAVTMDYAPALSRLLEAAGPLRGEPSQDFVLKMDRALEGSSQRAEMREEVWPSEPDWDEPDLLKRASSAIKYFSSLKMWIGKHARLKKTVYIMNGQVLDTQTALGVFSTHLFANKEQILSGILEMLFWEFGEKEANLQDLDKALEEIRQTFSRNSEMFRLILKEDFTAYKTTLDKYQGTQADPVPYDIQLPYLLNAAFNSGLAAPGNDYEKFRRGIFKMLEVWPRTDQAIRDYIRFESVKSEKARSEVRQLKPQGMERKKTEEPFTEAPLSVKILERARGVQGSKKLSKKSEGLLLPPALFEEMEPTYLMSDMDDPGLKDLFMAQWSATHSSDRERPVPGYEGLLDGDRSDLFEKSVSIEGISNGVRILTAGRGSRPNHFYVVADMSANLPQVMNQKAFEYMAAIVRALSEGGQYRVYIGFDSMIAGARFRQLYFSVMLVPVSRGASRLDQTARTEIAVTPLDVRVEQLTDYRARAVVFSGKDPQTAGAEALKYIGVLRSADIPHNVILSGGTFYIFPRSRTPSALFPVERPGFPEFAGFSYVPDAIMGEIKEALETETVSKSLFDRIIDVYKKIPELSGDERASIIRSLRKAQRDETSQAQAHSELPGAGKEEKDKHFTSAVFREFEKRYEATEAYTGAGGAGFSYLKDVRTEAIPGPRGFLRKVVAWIAFYKNAPGFVTKPVDRSAAGMPWKEIAAKYPHQKLLDFNIDGLHVHILRSYMPFLPYHFVLAINHRELHNQTVDRRSLLIMMKALERFGVGNVALAFHGGTAVGMGDKPQHAHGFVSDSTWIEDQLVKEEDIFIPAQEGGPFVAELSTDEGAWFVVKGPSSSGVAKYAALITDFLKLLDTPHLLLMRAPFKNRPAAIYIKPYSKVRPDIFPGNMGFMEAVFKTAIQDPGSEKELTEEEMLHGLRTASASPEAFKVYKSGLSRYFDTRPGQQEEVIRSAKAELEPFLPQLPMSAAKEIRSEVRRRSGEEIFRKFFLENDFYTSGIAWPAAETASWIYAKIERIVHGNGGDFRAILDKDHRQIADVEEVFYEDASVSREKHHSKRSETREVVFESRSMRPAPTLQDTQADLEGLIGEMLTDFMDRVGLKWATEPIDHIIGLGAQEVLGRHPEWTWGRIVHDLKSWEPHELLAEALKNGLAAYGRGDREGLVHLKVLQDADHVYLEVSDDGIGIASLVPEDLYGEYFKIVSKSPAREGSGRFILSRGGIGVLMSQIVTQAHDGTMEALSPGLDGHKTTIRFKFPQRAVRLTRLGEAGKTLSEQSSVTEFTEKGSFEWMKYAVQNPGEFEVYDKIPQDGLKTGDVVVVRTPPMYPSDQEVMHFVIAGIEGEQLRYVGAAKGKIFRDPNPSKKDRKKTFEDRLSGSLTWDVTTFRYRDSKEFPLVVYLANQEKLFNRSETRNVDFYATINIPQGQERFKIGKAKMDLFSGEAREVPFEATRRMYGTAKDPKVIGFFPADEEKEHIHTSEVLEGQFTDIHVPGSLAFARCYVRGHQLVVAEVQSDIYPFLKKDETTRTRYKDWRKVMRLVLEAYARTLPGVTEIVSPGSETILERWPERAFPGVIARLQHYGKSDALTRFFRAVQIFATFLMRPMIPSLFKWMGGSPAAERMKKRLYMKALDPDLARIVYDQNMPDFGYVFTDLSTKIPWEGGLTLKRAWVKKLQPLDQDLLTGRFLEHLRIRSEVRTEGDEDKKDLSEAQKIAIVKGLLGVLEKKLDSLIPMAAEEPEQVAAEAQFQKDNLRRVVIGKYGLGGHREVFTQYQSLVATLDRLISVAATKSVFQLQMEIPEAAVVVSDPLLGKIVNVKALELDARQLREVAAVLGELEAEAFHVKQQDGVLRSGSSDKWERNLTRYPAWIFIDAQGRIAGGIYGRLSDDREKVELVRILTVKDGLRGRGTWLMDVFLSQMFQAGVREVFWQAFSEASRDFYDRYLEKRERSGAVKLGYHFRDDYQITLLRDILAPATDETDDSHKQWTVQEVVESLPPQARELLEKVREKDEEILSHMERVMRLAVMTAVELRLPHSLTLAQAALLHDIGKLEIPEEILKNPNPLSDPEWIIMKTHSRKGADLLSSIPGLEKVRETVLSHHERMDGRGYPRGLIGKEISVEARIIAVADSFDAMTVERVYRNGITAHKAVGEFVRHAEEGRLDMKAVKAFAHAWHLDSEKRRRRGEPLDPASRSEVRASDIPDEPWKTEARQKALEASIVRTRELLERTSSGARSLLREVLGEKALYWRRLFLESMTDPSDKNFASDARKMIHWSGGIGITGEDPSPWFNAPEPFLPDIFWNPVQATEPLTRIFFSQASGTFWEWLQAQAKLRNISTEVLATLILTDIRFLQFLTVCYFAKKYDRFFPGMPVTIAAKTERAEATAKHLQSSLQKSPDLFQLFRSLRTQLPIEKEKNNAAEEVFYQHGRAITLGAELIKKAFSEGVYRSGALELASTTVGTAIDFPNVHENEIDAFHLEEVLRWVKANLDLNVLFTLPPAALAAKKPNVPDTDVSINGRSEIRTLLAAETKFTELLEVLKSVVSDKAKRKAKANELVAALRKGRIHSYEDVREVLGPDVSIAKLKTLFEISGLQSRAPPATSRKGFVLKASLAVSLAVTIAIAAFFVFQMTSSDTDRIARRFNRIAATVMDPAARESIQDLIKEFREHAKIDETRIDPLSIHPFIRQQANKAGELSGIQVNKDFALEMPQMIVKYVVIHEGTHLRNAHLRYATNQGFEDFMKRLNALRPAKGTVDPNEILKDPEILRAVFRTYASQIEDEKLAYQAEDEAMMADIRSAGSHEAFVKKMFEGLGDGNEDRRRNGIVVGYMEGVGQRWDAEKGTPSEDGTQAYVLKVLLNTPYLEQGVGHLHYLRNVYLQTVYAMTQGTADAGMIQLTGDLDRPFRVTDYKRLAAWTYEQAQKLGVHPQTETRVDHHEKRSEVRSAGIPARFTPLALKNAPKMQTIAWEGKTYNFVAISVMLQSQDQKNLAFLLVEHMNPELRKDFLDMLSPELKKTVLNYLHSPASEPTMILQDRQLRGEDFTAMFFGRVILGVGEHVETSPVQFEIEPLADGRIAFRIYSRGDADTYEVDFNKTYMVARDHVPEDKIQAAELFTVDSEFVTSGRHFSFRVFRDDEGNLWITIEDYRSTNGTVLSAEIYPATVAYEGRDQDMVRYSELLKLILASLGDLLKADDKKPVKDDPIHHYKHAVDETCRLYQESAEFGELEKLRKEVIQEVLFANVVGQAVDRTNYALEALEKLLQEDRISIWLPVLEVAVSYLPAGKMNPKFFRLLQVISSEKIRQAPTKLKRDVMRILSGVAGNPTEFSNQPPLEHEMTKTIRLDIIPGQDMTPKNRSEVRTDFVSKWRDAQRRKMLESPDLRLLNYLVHRTGFSPEQKKAYIRLWELMSLSVPLFAISKTVLSTLSTALVATHPLFAFVPVSIWFFMSPFLRLVFLIAPFTWIYKLRVNTLFWANFFPAGGAFIAVPSQLFELVRDEYRRYPGMSFKQLRDLHHQVIAHVSAMPAEGTHSFSREALLARSSELTFNLLEWRSAQHASGTKVKNLFPDDISELLSGSGPRPRSEMREGSQSDFRDVVNETPYLEWAPGQMIEQKLATLLPEGAKVLDLMSGKFSYVPAASQASEVIGVGLNDKEMALNKKLTSYRVQDVNEKPAFPEEWKGRFDAVVMTSGAAYAEDLPSLFRAAAETLKEGGTLFVAYNPDYYSPEATAVWKGMKADEKAKAVTDALEAAKSFSVPRHERKSYVGRFDLSQDMDMIFAVKNIRSEIRTDVKLQNPDYVFLFGHIGLNFDRSVAGVRGGFDIIEGRIEPLKMRSFEKWLLDLNRHSSESEVMMPSRRIGAEIFLAQKNAEETENQFFERVLIGESSKIRASLIENSDGQSLAIESPSFVLIVPVMSEAEVRRNQKNPNDAWDPWAYPDEAQAAAQMQKAGELFPGKPVFMNGAPIFYTEDGFMNVRGRLMSKNRVSDKFAALLGGMELKTGFKTLDVGTGSGIFAALAVQKGSGQVTATDTDDLSLELAKWNVRRLGLQDKVRVAYGDPFTGEAVGVDEKFDLILASLPLQHGAAAAKQLTLRFLRELPAHLDPNGKALVFLYQGTMSRYMRRRTDLTKIQDPDCEKVFQASLAPLDFNARGVSSIAFYHQADEDHIYTIFEIARSKTVSEPIRPETKGVQPKLRQQLEKIKEDPSAGLDSAKIQDILTAIENGSLKLKGEDVDIIKSENGIETVIGAIDRNIAHRYGLMHRVPTTFIMTPEGKFLLQRRAHNIAEPMRLSLFGGHVQTRQGYRDTVKHEIVEELGLPEDWKIDDSKLQTIRTEGAFASPEWDGKNRERRSHYVYFASIEEIQKIRATGKLLETKLAELGEAGFKQWLEAQQKAKNGLGEVWSIHEYAYDELMSLGHDQLSSDLLAPLLHDPANQDVRDVLEQAANTNRSEVRDAERFANWEGLKAKAAGSEVSHLLDPAYILHDWMILSVVNPSLKDYGLIYGAAGVDLSNALLSTNMTRGLFISDYFGWFKDALTGAIPMDPRQILDPGTRARWLASELADRYRYNKEVFGYSVGEWLRGPLERLIAMTVELDALGVKNFQITSYEQSLGLDFEWQHPLGKTLSSRTVLFVDADITRSYAYRELLGSGFNGYYQRAGEEVPLDYAQNPGFILELQDALPQGGYFITDDHAYYHVPGTPRELAFTDRGSSFPGGLPQLSIPHYKELTQAILKLRGGGILSDAPAHRYGWDVRIRKNEKDEAKRSEIRTSKFQKVEPQIEAFDPDKIKVVLSVSGADETDPTKQWFKADGVSRLFRDRVHGPLYVDREGKPYGSHDPRVEAFKKTVSQFIETYEVTHSDEKVELVLPNGNLGINDWFVGVADGKVYSSARDPKAGRVYDMLVTGEDGSLSVMSLQLMKPDGTRGIFDERGDPVTGIRYAVYGQRIVKNGKDNLKNLHEQFDDLRHIFRLPFFRMVRDGVEQNIELGFSDDLGELYRDPELIKLALMGQPIVLSLEPLLKKGLTVEAIRQKYLEWEYKDFDARRDKEKEKLDEGEFRIINGREIEIRLIAAYYPHSFIGLAEDPRGKKQLLVGNTLAGDSKFIGAYLPEVIQQFIARGAKDVFLWANGKDLAGTRNSRGTGLEAILLTKKRSEARNKDIVPEEVMAKVTDVWEKVDQLNLRNKPVPLDVKSVQTGKEGFVFIGDSTEFEKAVVAWAGLIDGTEEGYQWMGKATENLRKRGYGKNYSFIRNARMAANYLGENVDWYAHQQGALVVDYDDATGTGYVAAIDRGEGFPINTKGELDIALVHGGFLAQKSEGGGDGIAMGRVIKEGDVTIISHGQVAEIRKGETAARKVIPRPYDGKRAQDIAKFKGSAVIVRFTAERSEMREAGSSNDEAAKTDLEAAQRQFKWWSKKIPAWTEGEKAKIPQVLKALHEAGFSLRGGTVQLEISEAGARVVFGVLGTPRTPSSVYNKALQVYKDRGGWDAALREAGLDPESIKREPGFIELRNMKNGQERKWPAAEPRLESKGRSEARDIDFMKTAQELKALLDARFNAATNREMITQYLKIYSYTTRPVVSSLKGLLDHGLPEPLAEFFVSRNIWDKTDQSNVLEALNGVYAAQQTPPDSRNRAEMRHEDLELAGRWMKGSKEAAKELLEKGYWVSGFSELNRGTRLSDLLEETGFSTTPAPVYFRMLGEEKVSTDEELMGQVLNEFQINRVHAGNQAQSVIVARSIEDRGRKGIEILSLDNGEGIPSVLWAVEPGNSMTGSTHRGKGLPYILSAVRSEPHSFAEIHTVLPSGSSEAYRFLPHVFEPQPIPCVLSEHGTLVRIVRFAVGGRSEVRVDGNSDAYQSSADFLTRYTVQQDGLSYSVWNVIEKETPSAAYALKKILEARRWMDESGKKDRPLVIWQNMSLGQFFPYFSEAVKTELGVLELSGDPSRWNTQAAQWQPGKTRFILIKQKTASSFPGENREYENYEEEAWDPSVDMWGAKEAARIAKDLKAPLVMVDHSRKEFSNAQELWADQARREGAAPIRIRAGADADETAVRNAIESDGALLLLNANAHPEKQGSLFDDSKIFSEEGRNLQVVVGGQRTSFYDAFTEAYAKAAIEAVRKSEARELELTGKTPKDKSDRSEVRSSGTGPKEYEPVQSSGLNEKRSVRTAIENLRGKFTVMTDLADVAYFTDAQLQEFETMAILQPNVKFVFYGNQSQPFSAKGAVDRLTRLQRQLGAGRIVITEVAPEDMPVGKDEKIIRISKRSVPRSALNKKIFDFRYIAEETGLVPMALLYADQHEKPSEKGVMDLSMASAMLRVALQEFQNSIVFARAA